MRATLIDTHSDAGLHGLLTRPWVYSLFRNTVMPEKTRKRYVAEFIKPFPGCRILDIGCGPADMLGWLPDFVGEYVGFDMNEAYIQAAKRRWGSRGEFICQRVGDGFERKGHFDIVIAFALLHHLQDEEALELFKAARGALRDHGHLMTHDPVYIPNQHPIARWIISHDRGKAVRTPDGYRNLASQRFSDIEDVVLHNNLRFPYTHFVMRCKNGP